MQQPTLSEMSLILNTLSAAEFRAMRKLVTGLKRLRTGDMVTLTWSETLQMAFWEWLHHLGCVDDHAKSCMLAMYDEMLQDLANMAMAQMALNDGKIRHSKLPTRVVAVADSYWGSTPDQRWYNLDSDNYVAELPQPAVTIVACDLTALFIRCLERLQRLRGPQGGDHAGSGHSSQEPAAAALGS